jgi:hypothetical protein
MHVQNPGIFAIRLETNFLRKNSRRHNRLKEIDNAGGSLYRPQMFGE